MSDEPLTYAEVAELRRKWQQARQRRETGQLLAWSLMLGVLLALLLGGYFGVIP